MSEEKPRGSEFLAKRYSEEDLQQLLAVGESAGVQLVDFFPYGVPAFDGASGTWRVTPDQIQQLLTAIVQLPTPPQVVVNSFGVVATEGYDVSFKAGSQRSR
jgi:hypothetical protein